MLPDGFDIDTRKKVFNDDGEQIAEFDIIIQGDIGSSKVKFLIECRDRPSEGPAPGSWIEQLVGRKTRFNFDKIMAVSTTGFAKNAIEEAQRRNIELRTIDTFTQETLATWLPFEFSFNINHGSFTDVLVNIRSNPDEKRDIPTKFDTNKANIILPTNNEKVTIKEIWQRILNQNPDLFDDVEENLPPKKIEIRSTYSKEKPLLLIDENGETFEIEHIFFKAKLKKISPNLDSPSFSKYLSENESQDIAKLTEWDMQDTGIIESLVLVEIL